MIRVDETFSDLLLTTRKVMIPGKYLSELRSLEWLSRQDSVDLVLKVLRHTLTKVTAACARSFHLLDVQHIGP
jgi:hypothetical protein